MIFVNLENQKLFELLAFLACVSLLILITSDFSLLLAPPYAVTLYLIIYDSGGKYSSQTAIAISYLFVLATTEILHIFLGVSEFSLILNVIVVGLFISLSRHTHPPALALTIFSYIVHATFLFIVTSLLALALILVMSYIVKGAKNYIRKGSEDS